LTGAPPGDGRGTQTTRSKYTRLNQIMPSEVKRSAGQQNDPKALVRAASPRRAGLPPSTNLPASRAFPP